MLSELYVTKYKSDIEEILTHNSIDEKRLCEILYALRDTNGVDVEILRRTQIEICINNVRNTCKKSSKIMRATKDLLQKWKKIANDESAESESTRRRESESEFKMPDESCVYRLVYKKPESSAETKAESESVQNESESKNFQDYESEFKMPGESCIYPLTYKEPGTAKKKAQIESVQNKPESKIFQESEYESETVPSKFEKQTEAQFKKYPEYESESALQRCRAYEPYVCLTDIKHNSNLLLKLYSDSSSEIPKPIAVRRAKRKSLDNESESEYKLKKSKTRRRLVVVESSDDESKSESKSENLNDDEFRQKSIEMLTSALKSNESNPNKNEESEKSYRLLRIATTIEACIFHEYSDSTDKRYKSKVRSRVMNLRDRNNPDFRRNVISGHVTPAQAASMSVEAMASSKLKELRKTIEEQTLKEHELQDGSEFLDKSSMFACPECQRRDSSYTISLSMTSLMCNKCGYHWKNV